ncbi:MAG: hypothetical protein M1837_006712 [Sclerophora amabilis]|nr:MAG: hypothetical protein M1837_006712 [Sclerophora amabilis]
MARTIRLFSSHGIEILLFVLTLCVRFGFGLPATEVFGVSLPEEFDGWIMEEFEKKEPYIPLPDIAYQFLGQLAAEMAARFDFEGDQFTVLYPFRNGRPWPKQSAYERPFPEGLFIRLFYWKTECHGAVPEPVVRDRDGNPVALKKWIKDRVDPNPKTDPATGETRRRLEGCLHSPRWDHLFFYTIGKHAPKRATWKTLEPSFSATTPGDPMNFMNGKERDRACSIREERYRGRMSWLATAFRTLSVWGLFNLLFGGIHPAWSLPPSSQPEDN